MSIDKDGINKTFQMQGEEELRLEVDFKKNATVKLVTGTAEVFGTELAKDRAYKFSGTKVAVFTWRGCTLQVEGHCHVYTAEGTPMGSYMQVHRVLEQRRFAAKRDNLPGPSVMIVGPSDSGKSTLSRLLLGWAARGTWQPVFLDLDVGQNSITIPGMLAATPVHRPIDVEEPFGDNAPLLYFYGGTSPDTNSFLFKQQLENLTSQVKTRLSKSQHTLASGSVINTCGWVEGLGYKLLLDALEIVKPDVLLVLDHDRLYNDLSEHVKQKLGGKEVEVVKLHKSGGVVMRSDGWRRQGRMDSIKEYFYGTSGELCPASRLLHFSEFKIFKVGGGPKAPQSALPIGAAPTVDPAQLTPVAPGQEILHSVLAVSFATTEDKLLSTNVAGFVYVTEVHTDRQKISVLAPCPGPIPGSLLILTSLKWLE